MRPEVRRAHRAHERAYFKARFYDDLARRAQNDDSLKAMDIEDLVANWLRRQARDPGAPSPS